MKRTTARNCWLALLTILMMASFGTAEGQASNQEWIALKRQCGIPMGMVEQDWVAMGRPCPWTGPPPHVIVTPEGAVRTAELAFPMAAGAVGALETNPAGQYAALPWAGTSMLISEMVLAANRTHFSKGKVMTLSVVNMTAAGAGAAGLEQFQQENVNKSTAKPSATVVATGALAGAGTGVLLGFAMSHSQGTASSSHFLRALGHMYLGGTPHRMDLRITW
jgi:hypothetical protein